MPLTTHFWNWDRSVLEKAVAELTRGWSGGELDLSATAVVVPTAEAARRLREALAFAVSGKGGAVVAPWVWHPERALTQGLDTDRVASGLRERLAWSRVLTRANLAKLTGLFPSAPEEKSPAWVSPVAETLRALRHALGAGGLTMADARAALAGVDGDARWRDLASLDEAYLETIREWSLDDAQALKRSASRQPVLPGGVTRVLVFAVPDAPGLFQAWLRNVSAQSEVHIFVHAPESERAGFDAFGAPLVSAWGNDAAVLLPLPEAQMHRAVGPEDQARRAAELLAELAAAGCSVAAGSCEPAVNSVLEGTFANEGARVFNPAGRVARQHVLAQVLRDGWAAKHRPAWRAWLPFLRHHDVLQAMSTETGARPVTLLAQLDEFHAAHQPATLEDALELSAGNDSFREWHDALRSVVARSEAWGLSSSAEAIRAFLGWIYGAREFDSTAEGDRHFGDLFGEALRLADEVDAAGCGTEWLGLALDALEETPLGDVHGEADLVLHGWLELLWEPARGLVITGFNDEHVPGVVTVDPFLPDQAREKLGLSCQAQRRARDAYLLRAMVEQRVADRGLHVIFGHVNAEGDALRPSRLLLDCADPALPQRVRHLFPVEKAGAAGAAHPRREFAFALRPERRAWRGGKVSPSELKSYLACPFRFYLRHVLRLQAVDSGQRELSPSDLGSLMHEVLKGFADGGTIADSRDAAAIADWLEADLEKRVARRYGAQPLFSVALQIESLRQRLRRFAEVQAGLREEGWRILAAEERIAPEDGLMLGDAALSGKIDRVDRHEKTGVLRVIDYKTSASERGPAGAHARRAKAGDLEDGQAGWQCFDDGRGKTQRWLDLQLPLYALAASARWPEAPAVEAAYFCLPAAVDGIGVKDWKRDAKSGALWSEALVAAARDCAAEGVRRMAAGIFWPPADDLAHDEFEDLLLEDARVSVREPEGWEVVE